MNHRKLSWKKALRLLIMAVLVYAVILIGLRIAGDKLDGRTSAPVYGDISGRFLSKITKTYNGKDYHYREKQLVNILLIGIDSDELNLQESGRFGDQADFMLLLSIDKHNKRILPIHIDRDTMTKIQIYGAFGDPAGTRTTQLCLAQAFGDTEEGSMNTASAVSDLLSGIPVDYYLTLDMNGITILNDALGGVTVTLDDDFSHIDPEMKKGSTIRLHGEQAEIFVRHRRDVSDGTNAARMRRQRVYMDAALSILLDKMSTDLEFVGNLYDTLQPELTTNMDRGFFINEAYGYAKYSCEDIVTLAGTHTVGADGFMEFYPDPQALDAFVIGSFFE